MAVDKELTTPALMVNGFGVPVDDNIAVALPRDALAFFPAAALRAEVLRGTEGLARYHETYVGAFVCDADGNNVEAVCYAPG